MGRDRCTVTKGAPNLHGGRMRKKLTSEIEEERSERVAKEAERRTRKAAEKDRAIDAMIKESIKLHGP